MQQARINILYAAYIQGKECFGRSIDVLATNVGTPMWHTPPFQLFLRESAVAA